MRSKVSLYEQIRKAHEREGLGIRALARRFRVHRREVRQALASAVPPARKVPLRAAPKLDAYKPIIDAWLEEDRRAPRKQRHTARRVWQRLVEEDGATVSETTVRRYVATVRARQELPLAEVCVSQLHPFGEEAEVDFGAATVELGGVPIEVHLFIMRLSASGSAYPHAYLNESQDVFLDGHVRAFNHFGGVPTRVRYDNLKSAVEKVLKGRGRIESERFVALRSHYGFDSFFCQPGIKGAHEKGGVEGEIGRFRRRHMVPVPKVASIAELNEALLGALEKDDSRHIAGRRASVAEHFALEAPHLRALPAEPFAYQVIGGFRVDRKARLNVRGAWYSVPAGYAGRRIDVRVGAESIEALEGAKVIARHARSVQGVENLVLDHYLEVLTIKPGALPGATALARARAAGAFSDTHQRFWDQARRRLGDREGTKALIEVLLLHRSLAPAAVIAGMTAALSVDKVDPAVVNVEARRAGEAAPGPAAPIGAQLARYDRPAPDITRYDGLLEGSA